PHYAECREEDTGRESLYRAAGYDIDLKFVLLDDNNKERLIGQILSEQETGTEPTQFKVQLLRHGSVVDTTNADDTGEFMFAQLISGTYDLKVFVRDGEINIERVPTALVK